MITKLPRLIPCLLIDENEDLIKTVNFKANSRRYIGDVVNAVKIFSEKKVDEIMILDIDASKNNNEINYDIINKLAKVSRMPLAYGGGIKNFKQVQKIFSLGVEKIILNSVIYENINLIEEVAQYYGSQSVAVCLDIDLSKHNFKLSSKNNTKEHPEIKLNYLINNIQKLGAGEIIINSIDRDGTMKGYNLIKIETFFENIRIPITLLGGAGHYEHFLEPIKKIPISGLAAGSFFIYKGKNKAVLLNYFDIKKLY